MTNVMPQFKPIPPGTRFTRLVIVEEGIPHISRSGAVLSTSICKCDCGNTKQILNRSLKTRHTTSCGCVHKEMLSKRVTTHGHSRLEHVSKTYRIWMAMHSRCENPKQENFKFYGGHGIVICPRWKDFRNFLMDMGECPSGYTIERVNNNGNYEPSNCVWATRSVQLENKRSTKHVTINGETHCVAYWVRKFGVWRNTYDNRIKRGWTALRALGLPP